MRAAALVLAAPAALALACGPVHVTPSAGQVAGAKPPDCTIEFLPKPPDRPYDALAELRAHVTDVPKGGALQVLRPKACELGADAVIVTRNVVTNMFDHRFVAGIAIQYRPEEPGAARPEEPGAARPEESGAAPSRPPPTPPRVIEL